MYFQTKDTIFTQPDNDLKCAVWDFMGGGWTWAEAEIGTADSTIVGEALLGGVWTWAEAEIGTADSTIVGEALCNWAISWDYGTFRPR